MMQIALRPPGWTLSGRRTAAVVLAGFCTFLNVYTPQAILPALAATFHVPAADTGLTITATLLAVACVAPFVGTISDRLGRKRLIVGACALLVLPTLAVASSRSLEAMIAWRFVQGLLFPFIFAVTVAYIGDECDGADIIRTSGNYALGTIFGGFSGRFVAGIASDLGGWRFAFVVLAVVTGLGAAAIGLLLPPEQRFRRLAGGIGGALRTYRDHLTNPRLLATCAIGFGMLFGTVASFTYVNFYLAAPPFGLGPGALAFVFSVYLLAAPTTPIGSRVAIRIGRRRTMFLACGLAAAGLALTLVPMVPAVIMGLAGICGGLFVVQSLSLGFIGVTVRRAKSTAVGLYVTIYYIGGALGGIVPGILWRVAGWPGVTALVGVMLAVMAAAASVWWREPPIAETARDAPAGKHGGPTGTTARSHRWLRMRVRPGQYAVAFRIHFSDNGGVDDSVTLVKPCNRLRQS
jgi:predicted MFS family arabinose efflux permease